AQPTADRRRLRLRDAPQPEDARCRALGAAVRGEDLHRLPRQDGADDGGRPRTLCAGVRLRGDARARARPRPARRSADSVELRPRVARPTRYPPAVPDPVRGSATNVEPTAIAREPMSVPASRETSRAAGAHLVRPGSLRSGDIGRVERFA